MHEDKNTKTFHQTTLAVRRSNKIIRLKGALGEWIEEEGEIMRDRHSFYANLFTSGRPIGKEESEFDYALRCIHIHISGAMNDQLVRRAS